MLAVQPRRLLGRPRSLLVLALIASTFYWLTLHRSVSYQTVGIHGSLSKHAPVPGQQWPLNGASSGESTGSSDGEQEPELTEEEKKQKEEENRYEDGLRKQFKKEYEGLGR